MQERLRELYRELITVRRDLHAHPELAGGEQRTAEVIARRLRTLGIEGVANPERGIVGMPHSADFVADEEAIAVGALAMSTLLLDYLQTLPAR